MQTKIKFQNAFQVVNSVSNLLIIVLKDEQVDKSADLLRGDKLSEVSFGCNSK